MPSSTSNSERSANDPEVLLVDEVLAVGDEAFGHRCLRRIEEFLAAGKTLLFVSHSLDTVEGLCDRVLWLDGGRPRALGEPRRVVDAYRQAVAEQEGEEHGEEKRRRDGAAEEEAGEGGRRWGSREAEVTAVRLLAGAGGEERYRIESGEPVIVELAVRARRPLDDFVFGVAVATPRGVECWGTNTDLGGFRPGLLEGEATVRVVCPALRLAAGEYRLDVAVHSREGAPYDYRSGVLGFTVTARRRSAGVYAPEHRWEFSGGVAWSSTPSAPPIQSTPSPDDSST